MQNLAPRLQRLFEKTAAGVKFDLRITEALLDRLGHPEQSFASIHIAGTNGKGSVAAMLESVYRCAGFRTALYTSPHLVRFNERIQVEGVPILDEELVALFDEIEPLDAEVARAMGRPATFFEITTAMAFDYFQKKKAQLAIVETGMGGRLDATNVLMPEIAVITNIGLEHCAFLGNTIQQIAVEKAGIIKTGRPVVCGAMDDQASSTIRQIARERHAPFIEAAGAVSVRRLAQKTKVQRIKIDTASADYPPVNLPLLGRCQLENVATAAAVIEYLTQTTSWRASETAVVDGLSGVRWPARAQILAEAPLVVLDVAHNPAAAAVLAETLSELAPMPRWALVSGLLADKDADGFFRAFCRLAENVWVVPLNTPRAMPIEALTVAAQRAGFAVTASPDIPTACAEALAWAKSRNGAVCIAGSLYLAGEVLRRMEAGERLFAAGDEPS